MQARRGQRRRGLGQRRLAGLAAGAGRPTGGRRGWRSPRRRAAGCGSRPSDWAQVRTLYPGAAMAPAIEPPCRCYAAGRCRRRPARTAALAASAASARCRRLRWPRRSRLPAADIEAALLGLQTEGSVLQGRFTPGTPALEWCERHLLARIHRYTLKRLRQRDRAGRAARLRALPVRVAARRCRQPGQRPGGAGRHPGAARRLRSAGRTLGGRAAAGAGQGLRPGLARRTLHRGPHAVDAAAAAGHRRTAGRWQPSLRSAPILLLPRRSAAPGPASRRRPGTTTASARGPGGWRRSWPSTALPSSTKWSRARTFWAPNSRMR